MGFSMEKKTRVNIDYRLKEENEKRLLL